MTILTRIFSSVLALSLLGGCAYYRPMAVSTNSVGTEFESPTGIVKGRSVEYYCLPFYHLLPIGNNSVEKAFNSALKDTDADTISNVYIERKTNIYPLPFIPLVIRSETRLMGTGVRYKKEAATQQTAAPTATNTEAHPSGPSDGEGVLP